MIKKLVITDEVYEEFGDWPALDKYLEEGWILLNITTSIINGYIGIHNAFIRSPQLKPKWSSKVEIKPAGTISGTVPVEGKH